MQHEVGKLVDEICVELETPEPTTATGIKRLDHLLDGGLRRGEVFVLAARPRVGKSAFALQIALEVARRGEGVAIWSLEMKPKAWVRRAAAALSGVSPRDIRRGTLSERDIHALSPVLGDLKRMPLLFPSALIPFHEAADEQCAEGARLFMIDYLQLMKPLEPGRSREQEVAALSGMIKLTSIQLDIPILLLAQLNRNAEGKVPTLADLRESGAVEQDADEVFFLHRQTDPKTHVLENIGLGVLAKNRDGESGSVQLRYDWRRFRFEEIPL